jgi:hypothetical protein
MQMPKPFLLLRRSRICSRRTSPRLPAVKRISEKTLRKAVNHPTEPMDDADFGTHPIRHTTDKIDLPSVLPDFLVVFLQGWVFTAASRHVLRKDRHHTHPPSGLS